MLRLSKLCTPGAPENSGVAQSTLSKLTLQQVYTIALSSQTPAYLLRVLERIGKHSCI